jgi:hypothetical protein
MWAHFLIWLLIVIFTPLFLPIILTPATASQSINKDYNAAITIFGNKDEINKDIIALYKKNLMVVEDFVNNFKDNNDDSANYRNSGDRIGRVVADIPGNWASVVKLQCYSIALRWVILSKWGVWLLIPMAMGFIAGILNRRLKADTFSPAIPPLYNTSTHSLLGLTCLFMLWVICPIPVPVSLIPTAALFMTAFIYLAISNYPNY